MGTTIKLLIEKNKSAYNKHFYIESVHLSHVLVLKALKQILKEESVQTGPTVKLNECLKMLKKQYETSPLFKQKLKKSVYKSVSAFNTEYKVLNKALKIQYPELKLKSAAKAGINNVILLNTALVKLKSNQV